MQKIDVVKLFQSKNALIVDDFTDVRGSMKNMLKVLGCERIDAACDGNEAIQYCTTRQYDLVLCDYNLGNGKSGQQILEEIRFRGLLKNTSIFLMVTAESSRDMVYGALEYLPDDYLMKPFTQEVLEKRLSRLVLEKDFLNTIYHAMDKKDFHQAIALCEEQLSAVSRFKQKCLRIQSWCYFELKDYDSAKNIYEIVLGERDLEWARIGFGKCLLRKNDIEGARHVLQGLLDKGIANTEIYDLMSEVETKRGDRICAQKMLDEAVKLSPHSIIRQQTLAKVASENGDFSAAKKAHQNVMRLGNNSCYDSPENYLEYARCISTQIKNSDKKDRKLIVEAEETMNLAKRQFSENKAIAQQLELQVDFISANLQLDAGNIIEFEKKQKSLQVKLETTKDASPELAMDMARCCQAMGMEAKANELLLDLAARFSDNEKICAMIDKTSKVPITKIGKQKAADLNVTAKELFDKNDFKQAIILIDEALVIFPKNTGLNMNLLTALIKQMQADMATRQHIEMCDAVVARVGIMEPDNPQFARYKSLCGEIEKCRSSVAL